MKEILKKLTKKNANNIIKASAIAGLLVGASVNNLKADITPLSANPSSSAQTMRANMVDSSNFVQNIKQKMESMAKTRAEKKAIKKQIKEDKKLDKEYGVNIRSNTISERVAYMDPNAKKIFTETFDKFTAPIKGAQAYNYIKLRNITKYIDNYEIWFNEFAKEKVTKSQLRNGVANLIDSGIQWGFFTEKSPLADLPKLFQDDLRDNTETKEKRKIFKKIMNEVIGWIQNVQPKFESFNTRIEKEFEQSYVEPTVAQKAKVTYNDGAYSFSKNGKTFKLPSE